jgi:hypothetical protein
MIFRKFGGFMAITATRVENFNVLPIEEAEEIIYEALVPLCNASQVKLSSYGNHAGVNSNASVALYDTQKQEQKLFNVPLVQQVFEAIGKLNFVTSRRSSMSASQIAGILVDQPGVPDEDKENGKYSTGNVTAAMMLHGFPAHFVVRNQPKVSCEFKIEIKV